MIEDIGDAGVTGDRTRSRASREAGRTGTSAAGRRARGVTIAALSTLVVLGLASCSQEKRESTTTADSSTVSAPASVDTTAIEIASVDGPGVLDVVRQRGTPLVLVNVWATWCAPCREEFPDLMRLSREREKQGLGLVLVSADFEDQVSAAKRFLASQGAGFKSYLKTGDDMLFINTLGSKWSGALPATFLFDRTGHLIDFWEGREPYDDMSRRIDRALDVARATLPS